MNFYHSKPEEDVHINLTPLIDVVFLLLIFFMVSTTFDTTSQLKIKLPEASQSQADDPPQKLNLLIDASGSFFLNSRELTNSKSATLRAALIRAMGQKSSCRRKPSTVTRSVSGFLAGSITIMKSGVRLT